MPVVYKSLEQKGVVFRRGQLCLICAGPGTGKSALTLNYALEAKVPSLYLSADSDAATQLARAVARVTGRTMGEAMSMVIEDRLGEASDILAGHPMRMDYNASPTLTDIELQIEAYQEVYGDYPALIVIDNVTNVRVEGGANEDDPFSGLEGLMDYLHTMARETQACVMGLHHVTGPYNDAEKPIPLSGVKGQITRVPELVLTLHKQSGGDYSNDRLCVSPVKNRGGKSDASGNTYAELEFIGEKMLIQDPELTSEEWQLRNEIEHQVEEDEVRRFAEFGF